MFKKKRRSSFFYFVIISIGLLFSVHNFFSPLSIIFTKYVYSTVVFPVLWLQDKIVVPIKLFFKTRRTEQDLELVIRKVRAEQENLVAENVRLRASSMYYENIKELVDFQKQYSLTDMVLAKILFKHINEKTHFFLIDKGTRDGVSTSMVAIYKNFIVGKIVESYPFYSKVLLITDKLCKVAAICCNTASMGIHVGNNTVDNTSLLRVSHLSSVTRGDLVLSSGNGLVFPQNFALGKITYSKKNGLFYDVKVKPLFDIRDIDYCFIIQKGDNYIL